MGTAEGLYAGTGNVGAGVGALLLPRIFGTDYQSAFLWLGVIALVVDADNTQWANTIFPGTNTGTAGLAAITTLGATGGASCPGP